MPKRKGFSRIQLTVAVAVMVVALFGATMTCVVLFGGKSAKEIDQENITALNRKVTEYYMETGEWPDKWLVRLHSGGYTERLRHPTPFGGYYSFNAKQKSVVNTFVD